MTRRTAARDLLMLLAALVGMLAVLAALVGMLALLGRWAS